MTKRAYKERFYPTSEQAELLNDVRAYTAQTLQLDEPMNLPAESVEQSDVQDETEAASEPSQEADESSEAEPSTTEEESITEV
ncbi:MAG: helix-turn-helix domain-containing protein [Halomonas aquamarina]